MLAEDIVVLCSSRIFIYITIFSIVWFLHDLNATNYVVWYETHSSPNNNNYNEESKPVVVGSQHTTASTSTPIRNATIRWGYKEMKFSSTGPSCTLPSFFFMAGGEEGGDFYTGYNYTGGKGKANIFEPKTSCPDDVFENVSPDLRVPQLPWRLQNDWGCERELRNISVLIMENDYLKATIVPQFGGKIWSLYNKQYHKHMFFNNPAHQPANIGYRKAWSSGGCEWNWSPGKIGHSVFTEEPVWTAIINETEFGPVIRVYEYDRQNSTVWQVDIMMHGDALFAHPKITNPTQSNVDGYWWTCVAMKIDGPTNRILSPAQLVVNGAGGQCSPWPFNAISLDNSTFRGPNIDNSCPATTTTAWQTDLSFVGNIPYANDFFFHIDTTKITPYVAQVQEDGFTVLHSHPKFMNGTKFFQWGWHERGFYNTDFLSATNTTISDPEQCDTSIDTYNPYCMKDGHPGLYTELQIGPARTQMHTFPLAKNSTLEWTEWFKGWMGNTTQMKHEDYNVPLQAVQDWWDGPDGMKDDYLQKVDTVLKSIADIPPDQILSKGMPWGGLQQKLMQKLLNEKEKEKKEQQNGGNQYINDQYSTSDEKNKGKNSKNYQLAPGCIFPEPEITDETKPWLELLENGTFSDETLEITPINFEVSDVWVQILEHSMVDNNHATWLHYLFLGTHALEVGNVHSAKHFFTKSNKLYPSVHATRNLAIIASTHAEVIELYKQSWTLWTDLNPNHDPHVIQLGKDLSNEICGWYMGNQYYNELEAFIQLLSSNSTTTKTNTNITKQYLQKDCLLHAQAVLAVRKGDAETVIRILRNHCFPTYAILRRELLALWWIAQKQNATTYKNKKNKNNGDGDNNNNNTNQKENEEEEEEPLTTRELLALRKKLRCDGDSTTRKIDDPCICGPPNLGYRYG